MRSPSREPATERADGGERAVLSLLAQGLSQKQASQALHFSEKQATRRLRQLRDRLGLRSVQQLLILAGQEGWVRVKAGDGSPARAARAALPE